MHFAEHGGHLTCCCRDVLEASTRQRMKQLQKKTREPNVILTCQELKPRMLQFTSTTWKLEIIISCLLFSITSSFGWIVPDGNWATSSRGCRQPREKVYLTICVWTWQRGRSGSKVLCRCLSLSLLLLSAPPPMPLPLSNVFSGILTTVSVCT